MSGFVGFLGFCRWRCLGGGQTRPRPRPELPPGLKILCAAPFHPTSTKGPREAPNVLLPGLRLLRRPGASIVPHHAARPPTGQRHAALRRDGGVPGPQWPRTARHPSVPCSIPLVRNSARVNTFFRSTLSSLVLRATEEMCSVPVPARGRSWLRLCRIQLEFSSTLRRMHISGTYAAHFWRHTATVPSLSWAPPTRPTPKYPKASTAWTAVCAPHLCRPSGDVR